MTVPAHLLWEPHFWVSIEGEHGNSQFYPESWEGHEALVKQLDAFVRRAHRYQRVWSVRVTVDGVMRPHYDRVTLWTGIANESGSVWHADGPGSNAIDPIRVGDWLRMPA